MYVLKKIFQLRDKSSGDDEEKPFLEHLEDLRIMITRVLITLIIATIACFTLQERVMEILRRPVERVAMQQVARGLPQDVVSGQTIVPETWLDAKARADAASGLDAAQRGVFLDQLPSDGRERTYVQVIWLAQAASALPEDRRISFIEGVEGFTEEVKQQTKALMETDPELKFNEVKDIRFMSTFHPTETFMLSIKIAFFSGLVISFPLILYFILQFILPGLKEKERKAMFPALAIGFGLFLCGVLFAYLFVLPKVLEFFFGYGEKLGIANDWRIGYYVSFATQFTLLFGLSFELPVVVMTLVKLGILNYPLMAKSRSYAILAILIIAAILTPTPDIATLSFMAVPMILLYEICIWLAYFQHKKEVKREQEEEAEYKAYLKRRAERKMAGQEEDDDDDPDPRGPGPDDEPIEPRSPSVGAVACDTDEDGEVPSDEDFGFHTDNPDHDCEAEDAEHEWGGDESLYDDEWGSQESENFDQPDFDLDPEEEEAIRRESDEIGAGQEEDAPDDGPSGDEDQSSDPDKDRS